MAFKSTCDWYGNMRTSEVLLQCLHATNRGILQQRAFHTAIVCYRIAEGTAPLHLPTTGLLMLFIHLFQRKLVRNCYCYCNGGRMVYGIIWRCWGVSRPSWSTSPQTHLHAHNHSKNRKSSCAWLQQLGACPLYHMRPCSGSRM